MELLRIADFSRGIDKVTKKFDICRGYVRDATNAVFLSNGGFKRREGYSKYGDEVEFTNLKALLRYPDSTGGVEYYAVDYTTKPILSELGGLTSYDLDTNAGTGKRRAVTCYGTAGTAGEKLYIFPDFMVFNKTTLTNIPTIPSPFSSTKPTSLNFPVFHTNRIIAFNNNTAFWSDDHDGDEWIDGNAGFQVIAKDNKPITGAVSLTENRLVIFKSDAIYMLYGSYPAEYQLVNVSNNIGCDSPDSIRVDNNRVFWYYNKAIYSMTSGGKIKNITDDYIFNIFDQFDLSKANKFTATMDNRNYRLFLSDKSTNAFNNKAIDLDLSTMAWSYYSNMRVVDGFFDHIDDTIYFIDDKYVYTFGGSTDDGKEIFVELNLGWKYVNRVDGYIELRDIEMSFEQNLSNQDVTIVVEDEDNIKHTFTFETTAEGGKTWDELAQYTWTQAEALFTWADLESTTKFDNYACFVKGAKLQDMRIQIIVRNFTDTLNDIILRYWASGRKQRRF